MKTSLFRLKYMKYSETLSRFRNENFKALLETVVRTNCSHTGERDFLIGVIRNGDLASYYDYTERMASLKYESPWQHYVYAQLHALIKKNRDISLPGLDPKKEAFDAFLQNDSRLTDVIQKMPEVNHEIVHKARGFINRVLPYDSNLVGNVLSECAFGPGANIGVHGDATNVHRKMASDLTVTPRCLPYAFSAVMGVPSLADTFFESKEYQTDDGTNRICCVDKDVAWLNFRKRVKLVDYKKISFVPKTAKTHRVIAVEPVLNGFVQMGIGIYMRNKLRSVGIDLTDQFINQELAREGSLEDCQDPFVTIDLKSASDSITRDLVKILFEPEWLNLFDSASAPNSRIENKEYKLNQFVSMGNGFCFPLQSLIFASLAYACGAKIRDFHVYGDDIVVRRSVANDLIPALNSCGFVVNSAKTFLVGPFRESCGKDYFRGFNVRPLFLKQFVTSLGEVFKFHNAIRSCPEWQIFFADVNVAQLFRVPKDLCFVRPDEGPPDEAMTVDFDTFLASIHSSGSRVDGTLRWRRLRYKPLSDHFESPYRSYALRYVALVGGDSNRPFVKRYALTPTSLLT